MRDCLVSVSDHVFFNVVTSALEAYELAHVTDDGPCSHVETFGHLWGYATKDALRLATVYRLVWSDTSTAVKRSKDSVTFDDEAYQLKERFIDSFFPEVSYMGDFHSHPYSLEDNKIKTELEVERKKFYQFSKSDFESVRQLQNDGANYRVGLVATVYRRDKKVNRSTAWLDDQSCLRFQYDELTIWLKAYVWSGDAIDGFRRKTDKMVRLICPAVGAV